MKRIRLPLTVGLLSAALLLFAFFGTTIVSGSISFLYRNAAGFDPVRNVTQIAALLAAAGLFVTAAIVAIPVALQPVS